MDQPLAQLRRQLGPVLHASRPLGPIELFIDLVEIPDMRTMQDRRAELDWLNWILSPVRNQGAAHENDRTQTVPQSELANGIGNVEVSGRIGERAA